jgi:cytoskeletal protein CcmA (bactofilin family)
MFRRKPDEDGKPSTEALDDISIPLKPGARAATPPMPTKPPVMPPRSPVSSGETRPTEPARVAELPRRDGNSAQRRAETEMRKLIVGREIALSGEIKSCDRLVVEGSVEANLANCQDIDIAESGLFKGSASIDDAEIRGRFEGVLTVKKRLFVRSTGKVVGTIRYGQIEIECGGQISGDVQAQANADAAADPGNRPAAAVSGNKP